ncbi:MAG: hypothetical protein M3Y52_05285 [Actinomycetota bacterium]|nr:hypothetical protein [Actinomycetota bacterium]
MGRTPQKARRRSGLLAAAAISVSLAFGMSGCVASADDVAADMHASVVQIAERAVAGDYAGALAALALLDGDVAEALESGRIDAAREQEISAAIELVRADLEAAASAATPAPAPPPADDGGDGNDGDGNNGDGNNGNGNNGNNGNENGNSGNGNNGNGNSGNGDDGTGTGEDGGGDTGDGSGDSTEPPATEPPSTATPPATPDAGTGG